MRSKLMLMPVILTMIALTVLLNSISEKAGATDAELSQKRYCKMVQLHMEDPTIGWPDYNGNYDKMCK